MRSWNDTERQKHSEAIQKVVQRKREQRRLATTLSTPIRPTLPEPILRHMLQQCEDAIHDHRIIVQTHQALLREAETHRLKLMGQLKWYAATRPATS